MKEIVEDVNAWRHDGQSKIAVATVLKTWGSAPRRPGAKMAIDGDGNIAGSVSGGCVEGAVIELARESLETGQPRLLHFGVADETAWSVGLACGGSIDIFVAKIDLPSFEVISQMVEDEQAGTVATIVRGPDGLLGRYVITSAPAMIRTNMVSDLAQRVADVAAETRQTGLVKFDDTIELFVDIIRPSPQLVAVGGGDIALTLTKIAQLTGYKTVVVDPRRVFGSETRFPHVKRLIQKWPRSAFAEIELGPDMAVALLTHDPKIDDPALKILLNSDVFYIGALGSRKTHARRLKRLARMGFSEEEMARIHAPIGIAIGAINPQEIALSIMAEIVSERRGKLQS